MKFNLTSPRIATFVAAIVAVVAADLAAQSRPFPFTLGKVSGFADYHGHQMGQLGFGGRSYWGSHKGPEHIALRSCSGTNHAVSWLPVLGTFMGQPDLGQHPLKNNGWHSNSSRRYKHWPVWQSTTHQQYWEGHLRQAHRDGLKLFVMSAVSFDMFCNLLPKKNTNAEVLADLLSNPRDVTKQCDDMVNIQRQIRAAKEFDRRTSWYQIAYSPGEARRIIQQGKMAVVLSVEASKIWGSRSDPRWSTVLSRLNTLQGMGVRAFQITHEIDNNVGGVAIFHAMFNLFNTVDRIKSYIPSILRGNYENWLNSHRKRKDYRGHNTLGLTSLGKKLVNELMRRKLIVDVAHFSQRGVEDVYEISKRYHRYYPIHASHVHFRDMFSPNHTDEKKIGLQEVKKIMETGGTIGLRTGPERVKTFKYSGVANNCHGSSRSFAQSYMLATTGYRIKMGFGLDMTGMIAQVRPRFFDSRSKWGGKIGLNAPITWACGADVVKDTRVSHQSAQGSRSSRGIRNDYDLIGLAHVGHVKNLMRDLNKLGVQTHQLMAGAENFIAMWERQFQNNRGRVYANPNGSGIDHASYTRSCRKLLLVGPQAQQLGVYKYTSNFQNYGWPAYVPICQAFPDPTVQERNCARWGGTKYTDPISRRRLCIKRKSKDGKTFYNARRLVRDKCPVPYRYARTHSNGRIICKPTPHFRIKSRKCSRQRGFSWGGYCLWNKGYWYQGWQLK